MMTKLFVPLHSRHLLIGLIGAILMFLLIFAPKSAFAATHHQASTHAVASKIVHHRVIYIPFPPGGIYAWPMPIINPVPIYGPYPIPYFPYPYPF